MIYNIDSYRISSLINIISHEPGISTFWMTILFTLSLIVTHAFFWGGSTMDLQASLGLLGTPRNPSCLSATVGCCRQRDAVRLLKPRRTVPGLWPSGYFA